MKFKPICCLLSALAAVVSLPGCKALPSPQSVADPTSIYVWPEATCPSNSSHAGFLGLIAAQIGTDAISGLVNAMASALNNAAAADKTGYQISTNSAVYYDRARYDSAQKQYQLSPPACYVVAIAKPKKGAKPWCANADFAKALPKSCAGAGVAMLADIESRPNPTITGEYPLDIPSFYAEISVAEASYSQSPPQFKVVVPVIDAVWYPHPLIGGSIEEGKPRHISLTITFVNPSISTGQPIGPNPTDFFKGAAVAIDLLNITPAKSIDLTEVASNLHTAWTTVPIDVPTAAMSYKDNAAVPFKPISVTASLHEVGDPNAFLQAFASAFGAQSSTTAITNALAGAILPQSATTTATNLSNVQGAQSKYLGAVSTYQTACAKLQADSSDATSGSSTAAKSNAAIPADKTSLQSAQLGAEAAYAGWQVAELQANGPSTPAAQPLTCP